MDRARSLSPTSSASSLPRALRGWTVVAYVWLSAAVALACAGAPAPVAAGQQPPPPSTASQEKPAGPGLTKEQMAQNAARRARYPKEWDVKIPPKTKLDELRQRLENEIYLLPPDDLDDQTPIPPWFRVYLRKNHKALAESGPYQYPRMAPRLLQRMADNPNASVEDVK